MRESVYEMNEQYRNLQEKINVFDTTLRDGEQSPGVALTVDEKIEIAENLDILGVDKMEVGFPISSEGERETAKKVKALDLDSTICGLARAVEKDVDAVLDCDLEYVHTFIGTSPLHRDYKLKKSKDEVKESAVKIIDYCKDHGLTVEFSAEDGTRTEWDFLVDVYKAVEDAGVNMINVPDTVGILTPMDAKSLIYDLKQELKVPLSTHFHNDFGLAVANTLMGIEAGASQFHGTVNGIGERAGNASLEETIMTLISLYNHPMDIDTTKIYNVSDFVSRVTGMNLSQNKAIVGKNAFAHESGIHVHGIMENANTYEAISPEMVGQTRRIVLGKQSGGHAIEGKLKEFNIDLSKTQLEDVLQRVKSLGDKGKSLTDDDLKAIALSEMNTLEEKFVEIVGLSVTSGDSVSPTATVRLMINNELKEKAAIGVGPVDAALNAIGSLIRDTTSFELEQYHIEAINGGTDALGEVFVRVTDGEGNVATGRSANEDIIHASVQAVLNSVNKLLMIKQELKEK
ncbi:2-isopropylmalate synthase [Methanobrevibacter sp.]